MPILNQKKRPGILKVKPLRSTHSKLSLLLQLEYIYHHAYWIFLFFFK